jgi:HAE1 family hydrophobic/amphiphilic exporter-1
VEDVQITLVLGGILTVFIVFLFLNSWRSTVITGLALPVSVISTFIIMKALGFTLNILTLMGLSLAIGLLIDDAIVVPENIVRHMQAGVDHFTAAREATSEIGLAVMATTFTIVAVFVPVAFMGGIIGRFFFQFGITVGFAVLVSLYVSFTIDPMLSSRWYDAAADPRVPRSWLGRALGRLNRQVDRLQNALAAALGWSLSHRWAVVLLAVMAVGSSFWIFGKLGSEFMPDADPGQFQVAYKAAPGISLDRSVEIAREIEAEIRRNSAVAYTYATIGGTAGKAIHEGNIFIRLNPRKTREHYKLVGAEVRQSIARFRAIRTSIEEADNAGSDVKPIQISIRGSDLARLVPLSESLMAVARQIPGAADVDTSEEPPQAEVRLGVDRDAAGDLGLDLGTVASTVRGLVAGEVVSQFEDPDGDSYDVRLRVQRGDRIRAADLLDLDLPAQGGRALVPASQVASLDAGTAPSKIRRRDLLREVRVSAGTAGRSVGEVVNDIQSRAAAIQVPPGFRVDYTGDTEIMMESFGYAMQSLLLVSQFSAALCPHALASAFFVRRRRHALSGPRHTEHDVDDRHDSPDGPGYEKRHPGPRFRQHAASPGHSTPRSSDSRCARPVASHPDDHPRHDFRHVAPGLRNRRGFGVPCPHGPRRNRRPDHLHPADSDRGPGSLHLPR